MKKRLIANGLVIFGIIGIAFTMFVSLGSCARQDMDRPQPAPADIRYLLTATPDTTPPKTIADHIKAYEEQALCQDIIIIEVTQYGHIDVFTGDTIWQSYTCPRFASDTLHKTKQQVMFELTPLDYTTRKVTCKCQSQRPVPWSTSFWEFIKKTN